MWERCLAFASILAVSSCVDGGATTTETTETTDTTTTDGTTASSGESTTETTGGCGELPLCDLCPGEMGALCGLPCPRGAGPCSNPIGDGMSCEAGQWTCIVHPPLGLECNEVCALADACSEAGCTSGLTLVLAAAGETLPVGTYALATDADGVEDECTFTLSDDPQECALPPCVTDTTCNAIYLLDVNPQRIELVFGIVATLAITVTRDAVEVAQDSFVPAYEALAPNGPGCEPVCAQATAMLPIP